MSARTALCPPKNSACVAKITELSRSFSKTAGNVLVHRIGEADLRLRFEAEYGNNDIFPPSDITEDWLQLIDYDAENVVKVAPVRPANHKSDGRGSVI